MPNISKHASSTQTPGLLTSSWTAVLPGRIGTNRFRLPSPNGIHFVTPATNPKGALEMDLLDRFAGNDSWHTRNLLTSAASLTDDQLDRPLKAVVEILPWREKTNSLRQ